MCLLIIYCTLLVEQVLPVPQCRHWCRRRPLFIVHIGLFIEHKSIFCLQSEARNWLPRASLSAAGAFGFLGGHRQRQTPSSPAVKMNQGDIHWLCC